MGLSKNIRVFSMVLSCLGGCSSQEGPLYAPPEFGCERSGKFELLTGELPVGNVTDINGRTIMERLDRLFENKTVVVVAHRLSTVRNADKIVVLDRGRIVEQGTHDELTAERGGVLRTGEKSVGIGKLNLIGKCFKP